MKADLRLRPSDIPFQGFRLPLFVGSVLLTTVAGTLAMLRIMAAGGITLLEATILLLFAATFGWISVAFWNALPGFALLLLRRNPLTLEPEGVPGAGSASEAEPTSPPAPAPLRTRTAVVMPSHNEEPGPVVARLGTVLHSLERTGLGRHFHLFLLSDSTHPEVARKEERAWERLRARTPMADRLFYRRREANTGRKAGNVSEFCDRWGDGYDFLVVLDADSLMTGETLVRLARFMEANPDAGLLQTLPLPVAQRTLFGRILQFAAWVHGPMLSTGQSFWMTDSANYWGHNAILRLDPFRREAKLPVLPGRPPLGGEVLSHDFVEAALLRRAGWRCYQLPVLGGSFEQVPPNLLDYATRDRRWAQGSLQHLRLLSLPRLLTASRLHFLMGATGYVASLLWLLMLLAGTAYVLAPWAQGSTLLQADLLSGGALGIGGGALLPLLAATAILLFLPKGLALLLVLLRDRAPFGGGVRLVTASLLETLFAVVVAPVMMMFHSRFILSILGGRNVAWTTQTRDPRSLSWREAWKGSGWIFAAGVLWTGLTLWLSPAFTLWLSPILVGLLLAPVLVRWTARGSGGGYLFLTPPEVEGIPELPADPGSPIPPGGGPLRGEAEATEGERHPHPGRTPTPAYHRRRPAPAVEGRSP